MALVKVHRNQPTLDMTPMVDLAFLLVTFFMLTTEFTPDSTAIVDMPSSVSEIRLPDTDVLTITITRDGLVFIDTNGKYIRGVLISKIAEKYGLNLTEEEINTFSLMSGFGMPISNLKGFLSLDEAQRKLIKQPGVPHGSNMRELADWLVLARVSNPKLRVAIKGDKDAAYPIIKKVMDVLIDNNVTRFNLITTIEKQS